MKLIIAIILFLVLPSVLAINETPDAIFGSDALLVELNISSEIKVYAEKSDYYLSYVKANLTIAPKDYINQQVKFIKTQPEAVNVNDALIFAWENPEEKSLELKLSSKVLTNRFRPEVKRKVRFPLLTREHEEYTRSTENIDSDNAEIIRLASSLAAGEDDLYEVVNNLAVWTQSNVQYNLSTLTADVTQSASWVLRNKQGVCDELTALFIALNRALGIPAKFISGVAYTDSPSFPEKWGFHGWAEVYFPGYGWVPFDVTYGEYGYIDAGHIWLIATKDPVETVTKYAWKGRGAKVVAGDLKISAGIKEIVGTVIPEIKLAASPFERKVGFGSYNAIEVEVINLKDYYVSEEIAISKTDGLELIGDYRRNILLAPKEKKKIRFIMRISDDLDKNYIYTFPVTISSGNVMANTSFSATFYGVITSIEKLKEIEEKEEKNYEADVGIECSSQDVYIYEAINISCEAANMGNVYLSNVKVCAEECKRFDLGIGRKKAIELLQMPTSIGKQRIKITAEASGTKNVDVIELNVLDKPEVKVGELEVPSSVKFNDEFNLSFTVRKVSISQPKNAVIVVKAGSYKDEWEVENLEIPQKFVIGLKGNILNEGKNTITIAVSYIDGNNLDYKSEETVDVNLEEVNLLQRLQLLLFRLSNALDFLG
jgi:transglutaminase-like putative cysteine protease